jgi:hypothetical protein
MGPLLLAPTTLSRSSTTANRSTHPRYMCAPSGIRGRCSRSHLAGDSKPNKPLLRNLERIFYSAEKLMIKRSESNWTQPVWG